MNKRLLIVVAVIQALLLVPCSCVITITLLPFPIMTYGCYNGYSLPCSIDIEENSILTATFFSTGVAEVNLTFNKSGCNPPVFYGMIFSYSSESNTGTWTDQEGQYNACSLTGFSGSKLTYNCNTPYVGTITVDTDAPYSPPVLSPYNVVSISLANNYIFEIGCLFEGYNCSISSFLLEYYYPLDNSNYGDMSALVRQTLRNCGLYYYNQYHYTPSSRTLSYTDFSNSNSQCDVVSSSEKDLTFDCSGNTISVTYQCDSSYSTACGSTCCFYNQTCVPGFNMAYATCCDTCGSDGCCTSGYTCLTSVSSNDKVCCELMNQCGVYCCNSGEECVSGVCTVPSSNVLIIVISVILVMGVVLLLIGLFGIWYNNRGKKTGEESVLTLTHSR